MSIPPYNDLHGLGGPLIVQDVRPSAGMRLEQKMTLDFTPQFHRKLSRNGDRAVWVAIPHPGTLIPAKKAYYRSWQREEWLRLTKAGEEVVALPISH